MRRQGYTVAEVMAAVLILGLAFTALFQGTGAIRRVQAQTAERIEEGRAADGAHAALVRFLAQPGLPAAALADRLSGDTAGFTVQCGAPPCALRIVANGRETRLTYEMAGQRLERPLPGVRRPALRYLSSDGEYAHWPVSAQSEARLIAIAIVDEAAGASPVATVRLWSQQPQDCMFDSISAQCRRPLP